MDNHEFFAAIGRYRSLLAALAAACLFTVAGCDDGGGDEDDDALDFTLLTPGAGGGSADNTFEITWADNGDETAVIGLYFDGDDAGLDGALIAQGIGADAADSYTWDTSSLPNGEYWVYFIFDYGDGIPDKVYFPGSVTVSHAGAGPGILILDPDGVSDTTNFAFEITWFDDGAAGANIAFCYDTDDTGYDGTLIAGGIDASDAPDSHIWDTSSLSAGDYYVYAVYDDGTAFQTYAPGPITVTHSALNTYHVATPAGGGNDTSDGSAANPWATIQHALDTVTSAAVIEVRAGTYAERLTVNNSGSLGLGYITLRAASGQSVLISGAGAGSGTENNMIYLEAVTYVKIEGFEIVGAGTVNDASGVRIYSSGHHIEIRDCTIHDILGTDAMGITIYGADGSGIHDVVVDGCTIYDCQPAHSETLVVNGNVKDFEITDNTIRDVNNIGIDVIGGETWLSTQFPDSGLIAGNTVTRVNSSYDGSAAGIYSDGASNLVVERNTVTECDFGIEIGAENPGIITSGVIVRNNFVHNNFKGGIIFGGYDSDRGRVSECQFLNNTLYKNGRPGEQTVYGYDGSYSGEIIIQWADTCILKNNILFGIDDATDLAESWGTATGLVWGNNIYWRVGTGEAAHPGGTSSQYVDPLLESPDTGNLHIQLGSPAINNGENLVGSGSVDIDGEARNDGSGIDIGADER